jgi:hypothetical protein
VFVCIGSVRSAPQLQTGRYGERLLTGHGPSTAGTACTPPLLISAEDRAQEERPRGAVLDRSERKGAVAESLFRATLAARMSGRRWLESGIGSAGNYVSALCPKRSVELFGAWLHACGAQMGSLHSSRACIPALWSR